MALSDDAWIGNEIILPAQKWKLAILIDMDCTGWTMFSDVAITLLNWYNK